MPRFFSEQIEYETVIISGDDAKHISKVLRMRVGDRITVCDMRGTDYECEICKIEKTQVVSKIVSKKPSDTEPDIKISIFQALPKASKMEYIIQKCTEIGACEIVPCVMSRCIVKLDGEAEEKKKTARWQAICEAAAKQSSRGIIPEISYPLSFEAAVERLKEFDLCFACYEKEKKTSLKEVLRGADTPKNAAFLIGPEGGISDEEIEYIRSKGIKTVTLGKRILRTETAPTAVLAMMIYEFDK